MVKKNQKESSTLAKTIAIVGSIFGLIYEGLFAWIFDDENPYWGFNIAVAGIIIIIIFVLGLYIFFPR